MYTAPVGGRRGSSGEKIRDLKRSELDEGVVQTTSEVVAGALAGISKCVLD